MNIPSATLSEEEHKLFLENYCELLNLSRTRTVDPDVEGFFKKRIETEVLMKRKKAQVQQMEKASAAKVEKVAKVQAELEKKIELEAAQQRHNYREQLIVKQHQIDSDKEKLNKQQEKLVQETQKFNEKKEKAKETVTALKTVNKMYSSNLSMKMEIDESTGLITLIFQIPDSANKYVDYKITLKEKERDKYVVVNPAKDIQTFSDELEKTNNITKFLCQVREHAVNLIRHE